MTIPDEPKTRRDFIRGIARTAAAGTVLAGGVFLSARSGSDRCDKPTPCRSCKLIGRCELPEAQAFRTRQ